MTTTMQITQDTLQEYIQTYGHAQKESLKCSAQSDCSNLDRALATLYQQALAANQRGKSQVEIREFKITPSLRSDLFHLLAKRHGLFVTDVKEKEGAPLLSSVQLHLPREQSWNLAVKQGWRIPSEVQGNLKKIDRNQLSLISDIREIVWQGLQFRSRNCVIHCGWKSSFTNLSQVPVKERAHIIATISRQMEQFWGICLLGTEEKEGQVLGNWRFMPIGKELLSQRNRKGWEAAQKRRGVDGELFVGEKSVCFHEWKIQEENPEFFHLFKDHPSKSEAKELKGYCFEAVSAYVEYIYTGMVSDQLSGRALCDLYRLAWICKDEKAQKQVSSLVSLGMQPHIFEGVICSWKGEEELRPLMECCLILALLAESYEKKLISPMPAPAYIAWKELRHSFLEEGRESRLFALTDQVFPLVPRGKKKAFISRIQSMDSRIRKEFYLGRFNEISTDLTLSFACEGEYCLEVHECILREELSDDVIERLRKKEGSPDKAFRIQKSFVLYDLMEFVYLGQIDTKNPAKQLSLKSTQDLYQFACTAGYEPLKRETERLMKQWITEKGSRGVPTLENMMKSELSLKSFRRPWLELLMKVVDQSPEAQKIIQNSLSAKRAKQLKSYCQEGGVMYDMLKKMEELELQILENFPSFNNKG